MKKLLKWSGIILGSLVAIVIIGMIALPFILPLDKIKDLAAAKISETINREVKIEKVSFNLFEGIKLNGLTISNREGFARKPFVSADAIILRYTFWPLFQRQIIVKEISLVEPEILIEKNAAGVMNFADMTGGKGKGGQGKAKEVKKAEGTKSKECFSLIVDAFSIKKARVTYVDYGQKTSSEIKDGNLTVSGITLAVFKPIGLKFSATANHQGKDIPLFVNGKIKLDLVKQIINIPDLVLDIAGERAVISASISDWKNGPWVDFSLTSKKLSVDPLLAIVAAADQSKPKQKLGKGELTKKVNQAMTSIKSSYKVKARLVIENLTFLNFKIDRINLEASLSHKLLSVNIREIAVYGGKLSGLANLNLAVSGLTYKIKDLKLSGFNAAPFSNALVATFLTSLPDYQDLMDKIYGRVDASLSLQGQGVEPQDAFANAAGSGSLSLTGGEIKRLKILAQVGQTIKSNSLQEDLKVKDLQTEFSLRQRVVTARNFRLEGGDVQITFSGGADLANLKWVPGNRLSLKLSPAATQGLAPEFSLFRDHQGWLEITFELTGSLKLPIPKPILDRPVEAAIGKIKVKLEAKKIEIEKQAQEQVNQAAEEARRQVEAGKNQLAEEAKQRAAEEAKKQLQNFIKF